MLRGIGLAREQVYIANVLKCRPPGNRDPRPEEVAQCLPYLQRQIALLRPRIMLAVGRIAAQNLLATDTPIGQLRGTVHAFGAAADTAGGDLPSRLSAAFAQREAQGLGRSEVRAARCQGAAMSAARQVRRDPIRDMGPDDVASVAAARAQSYPFPWTEGIFRDCLRVGYYCCVAEMEHIVIGYGVMSTGAGEAHLLNLCVAEPYRCRGIGGRCWSI